MILYYPIFLYIFLEFEELINKALVSDETLAKYKKIIKAKRNPLLVAKRSIEQFKNKLL